MVRSGRGIDALLVVFFVEGRGMFQNVNLALNRVDKAVLVERMLGGGTDDEIRRQEGG